MQVYFCRISYIPKMSRMVKGMKFCITSGKGGVGKTSISVNLAYSLAQTGKKVLLVDGDLGLANVDVVLGLTAAKTVRDVLDRGEDPLETVIEAIPNMYVLPASSGTPELVTLGPDEQRELGSYLDQLATGFDYFLVDSAAGIGPSVLWFNKYVKYNLVVLTPDPTSVTDAYALMKVLRKEQDLKSFFVILNLVRDQQETERTFNTLSEAAKKFLDIELELLGAIPYDKAVAQGIRQQKPFMLIDPDGPASRAIKRLSERLQRFE